LSKKAVAVNLRINYTVLRSSGETRAISLQKIVQVG
jgi:hypothetical protein